MRWTAYDPDEPGKNDELSEDELDDVSGAGDPPPLGH